MAASDFTQLNVRIRTEIVEMARNAVAEFQAEGKQTTLRTLVEESLMRDLRRWEAERRKKFGKKKRKLNAGRRPKG